MRRLAFSSAVAIELTMLFSILSAQAADEVRTLVLRDHRFEPDTIEIPAGVKVRLVVKNQDTAPEEFDSAALNREKVIAGGSEGVVLIGPLDAGSYAFIGEYHADTAKGQVIVK